MGCYRANALANERAVWGTGSLPLHVAFDDSILHYQAVCQRAPADSH
jgi:hypothetical protein